MALTLTNWAESIGFYDTAQQARGKRILLMGPPKVGKTTFASTCPDPFVFDTDHGGASLADLHIPHISIPKNVTNAYELALDVITKLTEKKSPFDKLSVKTLVFDSLSTLAEMILANAMRYPPPGVNLKDPLKGKPEYDHYNILKARLHEIVMRASDANVNLVLITGQQTEKDDVTGGYVGEPLIIGGYRAVIGHDVDYIFYMNREAGSKPKFWLYTGKYGYFDCGAREPKDMGLDYKYENPSFDKIWPSNPVSK